VGSAPSMSKYATAPGSGLEQNVVPNAQEAELCLFEMAASFSGTTSALRRCSRAFRAQLLPFGDARELFGHNFCPSEMLASFLGTTSAFWRRFPQLAQLLLRFLSKHEPPPSPPVSRSSSNRSSSVASLPLPRSTPAGVASLCAVPIYLRDSGPICLELSA